jgi:hypothetical protein
MRRALFTSLGLLELAAAFTLFAFAWQLPGPEQARDTFGRIERVSTSASKEAGLLRKEVQDVRANQPKVRQLTARLQAQLLAIGAGLDRQHVDYEAVQAMSGSLGDVAQGLDGLSVTLDPEGVGRIGAALQATADYLDKKVAPSADRSAARLEKTTADLKADADLLRKLVDEAPLDLRAARAASAGLGKFDEGLRRMIRMLKVEQFDTIRDGFKGLEESLNTGASQIDRFAGLSYPAMRMQGRRPVFEAKAFWPEGKTTAEGMRKAAKGATAAGKEMDRLSREVPKLRASLEGGREVVAATKASLDQALKQEDKLGALVKNVPQHTARLAQELPALSADLAKVLRDTAQLREVALALRQTEQSVNATVARWPALRENLGRSSAVLRATQKQMQAALVRREQYDALAKQTLSLTRAWAEALPMMTDRLDEQLGRQERSLEELGRGLDEVSAAMPACADTASRLLRTTQLLLGLLGGIALLHACYLMLSMRVGPGHPAPGRGGDQGLGAPGAPPTT